MSHEGQQSELGLLQRYFGKELDPAIFFIILALTVPFVVLGAFWPDALAKVSGAATGFVFKAFQSTYLLSVTGMLIFCLAIAFSPWGKVRLGKNNEKPEFSTFSWFSMLFSAGMGIGLIFWSVAEPLVHMAAPPIGEANTFEAARLGLQMYFFHWGFHAWAIYAITGITIAYFQYRRGYSAMISRSLIPLIGEEMANGMVGRVVDAFAAWATIFGVVTGLGMGAMQLSSGISAITGTPDNANVIAVVILLVTLAFVFSAITGVSKGIKHLSNLNVVLMFVLIAFFMIAGPTVYNLKTFWMGLSDYMVDLPKFSFSTTLFGNDGWTQGWTVFFWAFWISWAPFVGAFIARISKGRTIKEFMLGVVILPPVFSFIFSAALGGATLYQQFELGINVADPINANLATALFVTLKNMPMFGIMTGISLLLIFSFLITSCDSATYVAARFATSGTDVKDPKASHRLTVTFGVILGLLAVVFNYSGGLKGLQSATITGSVPYFFVMILTMIAFVKDLMANEKPSEINSESSEDKAA